MRRATPRRASQSGNPSTRCVPPPASAATTARGLAAAQAPPDQPASRRRRRRSRASCTRSWPTQTCRGPYLLVGSSFGGLLISTFTARYPDDVVGIVSFDALAPGSAEGFLQLGPFPEPGTAGADEHHR